MSADEIANKLWNLCNVLRDDGVTYHQYLNELTYILFLKLSEVKDFEKHIPEQYRWRGFVEETDNIEAFNRYRKFLAEISNESSSASIKEIYANASTSLRKPVNFNTLVQAIDELDWYEENSRARCLLICGQPLKEPIARYGPFVMNTREEVLKAAHDFQSGNF